MANSELRQQLQTHFENRLPTYLNLLREMVEINSFTANPEGVNRLAELTAGAFAGLGFAAEHIQSTVPHYGKHLVLTKPGKGNRKIGFVSHLDTVFPAEEEKRNNFAWREVGDKIYGPGTVDIKGGTVMMYMIMEAFQKFMPDLDDDITWVLLVDAAEEAEAEDFGALCRDRLAGALGCLIFEGGNLDNKAFNIVVTRKGMAVYRATAEGRASHAGGAHPDGANAIIQLADTVQKIAAMTDYERHLTFNVGVISGGTVTNRVPHLAEARGEMRTFSPDIYEAACEQLLALNGASTVSSFKGNFPCKVTVEITRKTPPWPRNPETDRLYRCWEQAAEEIGYKVVPEERGGLSDGNHFWYAIPSIDGLGPSGGNAHCSEQSEDGSKEQEYVSPASFVPKALLNTFALLRLIEES